MATQRKSLYVPRFGSQSSQTDKKPKANERNCKQHKLSKNMKKATSLPVPDGNNTEMTPGYSRKKKTNHLWKFYLSVKEKRRNTRTSTDTIRAAEGGKSPPVTELTQRKGPSYDYFEFPTGEARNRATDEISRAKHDVLRTIKRMVEENRVIRERLLALSQMSQSK